MDADRPVESNALLLLDQARAGSHEAVCQLFEAHKQALRSLIAKRLKQPLCRLFDSDDFTQELAVKLWTFDLPPEALASAETFHAYLTTMAKNILHDCERRYMVVEKHNLRRDLPEEALGAAPALEQPPTVEFDIKEAFEHWSEQLPPLKRRIVLMMRAGETQQAIAATLKISERTVRRLVLAMSKLPPPPILP